MKDARQSPYRPLARLWECSQSGIQNNKTFYMRIDLNSQKRTFLLFCPSDWLLSHTRARGLQERLSRRNRESNRVALKNDEEKRRQGGQCVCVVVVVVVGGGGQKVRNKTL